MVHASPHPTPLNPSGLIITQLYLNPAQKELVTPARYHQYCNWIVCIFYFYNTPRAPLSLYFHEIIGCVTVTWWCLLRVKLVAKCCLCLGLLFKRRKKINVSSSSSEKRKSLNISTQLLFGCFCVLTGQMYKIRCPTLTSKNSRIVCMGVVNVNVRFWCNFSFFIFCTKFEQSHRGLFSSKVASIDQNAMQTQQVWCTLTSVLL